MTIKHLYPVVEPSLNLDFANSKKLDPRITFTRGSIGTYVGDDGLIKTAAQNEARFDHDSDGNSLGLLVEESRTNLLTYSEEFGNVSAWVIYTGGIITANTAASPDSTVTADTLAYDGVNSKVSIESSNITVVSGQAYSSSYYVKVAGGDARYVQVWATNGPLNAYANFDLVDNVIGTSSANATPFMETLSNGWYRIGYSGVSDYNNWRPRLSVVDSASSGRNGNYSGSNASIYLWGAQLEAGAFPTSYIPTDGTPGGIARAADVASITGSNFSSWYNQSEGSFFSQYIPTAGHGEVKFFGNNVNFWNIGATSVAGGVFGFRTISNQGSDANIFNRGRIEDSTNYGYVIKHAAAIADNDFACYTSSSSGDVNLNTGLTIPATGGYLTPLVDRLILTDDLTGVIRLSRLTYYPQRLPNATLQALTL